MLVKDGLRPTQLLGMVMVKFMASTGYSKPDSRGTVSIRARLGFSLPASTAAWFRVVIFTAPGRV